MARLRSKSEMNRLFSHPKAKKVMREFREGKLHHGGSGKIVNDIQVAHAIAMSEAERADKRKKK